MRFLKAVLDLSTVFLCFQTYASHRDLDIECESYFHPSCCTAISDSGGGAPITYSWSATKGYYDAIITPVNWTVHHCNQLEFGGFSLTNFVDNGVLVGHGNGKCGFPR